VLELERVEMRVLEREVKILGTEEEMREPGSIKPAGFSMSSRRKRGKSFRTDREQR